MKVENEMIVVERSETFRETTFRIKASAKAFQILSSGLYANKVRAIVRELGTNAADSHVAAGRESEPFLVHLPNCLEPWFSIRDYGTGLSQDSVEHIYSTYFESNKTDNNDMTGCLGLGSKSPFSYTDNFTVVSRFNGIKLTYSALIGEAGFPTIILMNSEATAEPNGLEISFPVKSNDFSKFRDEAESVYQYFKVQPKIIGNVVYYPKQKKDYEGGNWSLSCNTMSVAIMGNVGYPISLSSAGVDNTILFNMFGLRIYANIGELDMTASRESLEYTEKTCQLIQKAAKEAVAKFSDEVKVRLQEQKTFWEACVFYKENELWLSGSKLEWNGRPVTSYRIALKTPVKFNIYQKGHFRNKMRQQLNEERNSINIVKCLFVEDDLDRGTVIRIRHLLGDKNYQNTVVYVFKLSEDKKKEFLETIDVTANMVVKASTLEKPVLERKPRSNVRNHAYKLKDYGKNMMGCWELTEVNSNDTIYYVEMAQWNAKFNDKVYAPGHFCNLLRVLSNLGETVQVFGVRPQMLKKVKKYPTWKPLETLVEEVRKKHVKDYDTAMDVDQYDSNWYDVAVRFMNDLPKLKKFLEDVVHVSNKKSHYKSVHEFFTLLNLNRESKKPEAIELFKKEYPLAACIISSTYRSNWPQDELRKYFRMVDEANASYQPS